MVDLGVWSYVPTREKVYRFNLSSLIRARSHPYANKPELYNRCESKGFANFWTPGV